MTDPIGLAGLGNNGAQPHKTSAQASGQGPDFKAVLMKNLSEVNALQQDANKAAEDLMTGKRDDVEGVIFATQQADTAFKMLQSMRNQVMQAYDEIKQMRV